MRNTFIVSILIAISQLGFAQITTNSPYSSYGIGELGGMDNANFIGLGNNTITYFDSTVINYYNPASYNTLAKGQPLFSMGISSRLSTYTEGDNSNFTSPTAIQHMALAFPVKKNFGFAVGVKPYSRKGYEFETGTSVDGDSIIYNYSGSGGINEVFLGLSSDIIKFKSLRLAVGANLGYLFGESTNTRKSGLYSTTSSIAGGVSTKLIDLNTFHYDLGAYLIHNYKNHTITASATFEPSQNLKGRFENALYYSGDVHNPNFYDTLNSNITNGVLNNAAKYAFGLNYKLFLPSNDDNGRRLNSEISLFGMYTIEDWSKFSDPFDGDSILFLNSSRLSVGIQYSPETKIIEKAAISKFHERMKYRAGFYSYSLPYTTGNEQVVDRGVTLGFGFPFVVQKSLSSINLGFSYGTRGVSDTDQLQEKYYGLNLGITIAPGNSERWFRKPKLN